MMKTYYLDLMERVLAAYSDADIKAYFADVQKRGLTEHGFPRLTANIGRMIAQGRRKELLPMFTSMMTICCKRVSLDRAANDFSVQEMIESILQIEKSQVVDASVIDGWKRDLGKKVIYNNPAESADQKTTNWCLFAAVSEFLRMQSGLCPIDMPYIEMQLATQVCYLNGLGMYREEEGSPMVYDLVPRLLFSILLYYGYEGKYKKTIDDALRRAALLTLRMQSVSGEIPYGGRSNQFYYNEALIAAIFEYEVNRYCREGDLKLAAQFKRAACDALKVVERGLDNNPDKHIKNRFPTKTRYGCEDYAYFNKYMITTASYLNWGMLFCKEDIAPAAEPYITRDVLTLSSDFHKTFLRFDDYFVELDTNADGHYDCSGIGRIHKRGAPSEICLSCTATAIPKVTFDLEERPAFSIAPALFVDGAPQFMTLGEYRLHASSVDDESAAAEFFCDIEGQPLRFACKVGADGVTITAEAEGEVAVMLPALAFDGEHQTEIQTEGNRLSVSHKGNRCTYTTDGELCDMKTLGCNRNGHYKLYYAKGQGSVSVNVRIE